MANIYRGYKTNDYGTAGNKFVDAANGNDANSGTSANPKKTISAAIASLGSGGGTVKVKAGTYRESLAINTAYSAGAPLVIEPYGTDQPIITGAEVVTGWQQCTSADQALVGANYANIWKNTIQKSQVPDSWPAMLNPKVNGAYSTLSADVPDPANYEDWMWYDGLAQHQADSVVKSGSLTTEFVKPSVANNYTTAQMAHCFIDMFQGANFEMRIEDVTKTAGGNIKINPGQDTDSTSIQNMRNRFALLNSFPSLRAGWWAYTDNGSTVTVYVWPASGSGAPAVELARRSVVIDVSNAAHVTIQGFEIEGYGGCGRYNGGNAALRGNAISGNNSSYIKISRMNIHDGFNDSMSGALANGSNYGLAHIGVIKFKNSNHVVVADTSIRNCPGGEGVTFENSTFVATMNMFFEKLSRESTWYQANSKTLAAWNYHTNTFAFRHNNLYAGYKSADSLIIGCVWDKIDSAFFFANQENTNWFGVGCVKIENARPGSQFFTGDHRFPVFQDKANGAGVVVSSVNSKVDFANLTHIPSPLTKGGAGSVSISGANQSTKQYSIVNCIVDGYPTYAGDYNSSNVLVDYLYNAGDQGKPHGTHSLAGGEANTWVNIDAGDYSLKANAPVRTMTAKTGVVARLNNYSDIKTWLEGEGFTIDWTRSAIDTTVNYDTTVGALPYDDYATMKNATWADGGAGSGGGGGQPPKLTPSGNTLNIEVTVQ